MVLIIFAALVASVVGNNWTDTQDWIKYGLGILSILLGVPLIIEVFSEKNLTYVFRRLELNLSSRLKEYLQRISG